MKSVGYFFVYAIALFNCYVWMIWPELFYGILWKWDIFITMLFAPLIYTAFKNENNYH
jgi:hypothetical protein